MQFNFFQKRFRFLRFFIATLLFLSISACNSDKLQPKQTQLNSSTSCRKVKHIMGETCIPRNPQRIITLYTPPLANTVAFGIKPIGITPVTGVLNEFPKYLRNKVKGIEIVGNLNDEPNLEKIAQLKPDLIIGWDFYQKNYSLFSQISPTLLIPKDKTISSRENWKEYTKFLGESLGKKENAEEIINSYNQRIQELKKALNNKYLGKKISVAHVSEKYGIEAYTKNSFSGSILSDLELQRPESQDVIKPNGVIEAISQEKLELIDGDVLFVLNFSQNDKKMLEDLLKNPLWRNLKAVQNGQVYPVDGWTWIVANPLAADAVIDDLFKYLVNPPQNNN